jgi:membrane protein DedA with SNARE-associated domain
MLSPRPADHDRWHAYHSDEDAVARRRPLRLAMGVFLVVLAFVVLVVALPRGYLPGPLGMAPTWFAGWLRQFGVFAAGGLLALEEAGIWLPIPTDVFVAYSGHLLEHTLWLIPLALLGLTGCALLGATALYFISYHWGTAIMYGELGRMAHLNPDRIHRAEAWFLRWGYWAIIVARCLPGTRIPMSVAAGMFRVRYRVFAASVLVSTAVWAAFFLVVGMTLGGAAINFFQSHQNGYALAIISIVSLVLGYLLVRLFLPDLRVALRIRRPSWRPGSSPTRGPSR